MARQPPAQGPDPLIYSPAKRAGTGVLIMIAGPSGSGKTKSALRLATGLANGGGIGFCDTEHGRALYYADEFDFLHHELKEPFSPERFELAAVSSQRAGHKVWICDSFSHEHIGPGGMLDMYEATLQRMAGNDYTRREKLQYTAWIEPKSQHKHMLQRLWQLNMHLILCCHAEKKLDLIENKNGKTVPNPDAGLTPVCAPDIPYAMTVSYMMNAERPGVPGRIKAFDKIDPLVSTERVLDEETGRRIAEWASGKPIASARRPLASNESSVAKLQSVSGSVEEPENQHRPPPAEKPGEDLFPGDIPLKEQPKKAAGGQSKNEKVLKELLDRFNATVTRKDHTDIVDVAANRDRIMWFKTNKPEMHARLHAAIEASWERTGKETAKQEEAA